MPESFGAAERMAAADLFAILARLGGEELVGRADQLSGGTFWAGVTF